MNNKSTFQNILIKNLEKSSIVTDINMNLPTTSKISLNNITKKTKFKNYLYYTIIGTLAVGTVGGLFYLYSLLKKDDQLSDEQIIEVEEIKQQIQENNGEISVDMAIRILAQINKRIDEIIRPTKNEMDDKRRDKITNYTEYNKLAGEYFALKESAYNKATNQILQQFSMDISDLKEIMEEITQHEVEKKIFLYNKPNFNNNYLPDKDKVKEAFIYFGNIFIDEMSKFNSDLYKKNLQNESQDVIVFKMLVIKLRIDDYLYLKFKLNENQIRYLIFEYNLLEDKEVKSLNDKICKYEEVLYL